MTVAGKPGAEPPTGTVKSIFKQAQIEDNWRVMQYTAIIEKGAHTDWGAYVPDLPGCVAVGETREEVEQLIREAIELHLEGMREDGQLIPTPSSTAVVIDVAA